MRTFVLAVGAMAISLATPRARAETSVTIIGTSPLAACAAAAAEAKHTGAGTRFELETCDRAIETWPSPPANVAIAYINRSVVHIARGETAAAIADASRAIRLNATLGEAYLDRAIALSADQRSTEAIRDFERAIELNVRQPELAYFDRAIAREDSGDIKGAYFDYRRAAELNPAWDKPRHELARFTVTRNVTS